jgi:hypothetical protein
MKKLLILPFLLLAMPAFAADDTAVRVAIAVQEANIACQLRDDLATLTKLGVRRTNFLQPFADGDFVGTSIPYVNAYNANALFDIVTPALNTALAANSNQALNMLEQMCGD